MAEYLPPAFNKLTSFYIVWPAADKAEIRFAGYTACHHTRCEEYLEQVVSHGSGHKEASSGKISNACWQLRQHMIDNCPDESGFPEQAASRGVARFFELYA